MATVTLTGSSQIRMDDQSLVAFNDANPSNAVNASWDTAAGHDVDVFGSDFAYAADGRMINGLATSAQIDFGDDDFSNPEIEITGINLNGTVLDDSAAAFWNATLAGTTAIDAQALSMEAVGFAGLSRVFGDDLFSATAASDTAFTDSGGDDVITLGTANFDAIGDVDTVEGVVDTANPRFSAYDAGNDQILAPATSRTHNLVGDAFTVGVNAHLDGGDDLLQFSASQFSVASGDVFTARGALDRQSFVLGGDDRIEAKAGNLAIMTGDVVFIDDGVDITGGDDTITGAEQGETIAGDVFDDDSGAGSSIAGGADTIEGGGGDDEIAGDVFDDSESGAVTGGNDTIRGGEGGDTIFGEIGRVDFTTDLSGGDDRLFGNAGNDAIFGQTGRDELNGGGGADTLDGGTGNDRLTGGRGSDVFVFAPGSGADRVTDFQDGVDDLDLSAFGFSRFRDVKALSSDTLGGDLKLDFGGGDVLIVDDFAKASFTADDVIL